MKGVKENHKFTFPGSTGVRTEQDLSRKKSNSLSQINKQNTGSYNSIDVVNVDKEFYLEGFSGLDKNDDSQNGFQPLKANQTINQIQNTEVRKKIFPSVVPNNINNHIRHDSSKNKKSSDAIFDSPEMNRNYKLFSFKQAPEEFHTLTDQITPVFYAQKMNINTDMSTSTLKDSKSKGVEWLLEGNDKIDKKVSSDKKMHAKINKAVNKGVQVDTSKNSNEKIRRISKSM